MKNKLLVILLICLMFSGCISVQVPAALDKSFPSDEKYEILGAVSCSGKIICVLGFFAWGGIQYRNLGIEAEKKFEGRVDDVVSVSVDEKYDIFPFFALKEYTLRGIAIRYIKE